MCIIMYCPSGKTISKSNIENAFRYNPHGAGVMYYDEDGNVHFKKGFDKVDNLYRFWNSLSPNLPRALHCRIATSGKISTKTCHPFPIEKNVEDMGNGEGIAKNGCLMHNGIFSNYTPKGGMLCDYSDSMYYTAKVIYPLKDMIMNEGVLRLLQEMTSRVLLFLPKFKILRFGKWEEDKTEHFFASNDTYEERYTYYNYGVYGDWSDYYNGRSYCTYKSTKKDDKKDKEDEELYDVSYGYTNRSGLKQANFIFSILIGAKDKNEAEELLYEFCDDFYTFIYDEDSAFDTLQEIDDGMWEFCIETTDDINRFIKPPYSVGYFYDYSTEE